jgi:murein DD-endopeptidase MepM/ murein hydrolase activator NlpD
MKNKKFWISFLAGLMALIMILSLILGILPAAQAASSSEIRDQINQLEEDEKALQEQIDALKQDQKDNLNDVRQIMEQKSNIDQQIGLLRQKIRNMDSQISSYAILIADKQKELDEKQAYLQELNEKNKERIRAMEEQGELTYWSVLFQSSSFADLLDRMNMVEEIAAADQRRLKEMKNAAIEVEAAKSALELEKANLEASRTQLAADKAELENLSAESQKLLSAAIAKGEEFDQLMNELEEEHNGIGDQIANKEIEFEEAEYSEYMATMTKPTTAPTKPTTNTSGGGNGGGTTVDGEGIEWIVPVTYSYVSSAHGWRYHPISGEYKWHAGVDLAGSGINGRPIYASRGGVITYAGWYGAGGWTVKIDHGDGFSTVYMHMSDYIVSAGDYVAAGQTIGYVGSTGGSTGPHLHFEVRWHGEDQNPMKYIG